jgi:hypothetical protein
MVFRVGLRFANFRLSADDQSTYAVESAAAQNFRSASSVLKSGIFFFMGLIDLRFVAVHVPDRNDPYETPPNGENREQTTIRTGLSQSITALLLDGMTSVAADQERLVKEDILCFFGRDLMQAPVFMGVVPIPIECGTAYLYMSIVYAELVEWFGF